MREIKKEKNLPGLLQTAAPAVFVAAATFLCFLPALKAGFLHYDDEAMLVDNTAFLDHGWHDIRWMFTTTHMMNYQPLSWLTYGFDYALWGMNPAGFHLTNLLLHCLNAVLFYFLSLRLLRRGAAISKVQDRLCAAAASLFFSIHPLRVESVAWISERRDVLAGAFFLLTLLAYIKSADIASRREKRLWLGAATLAYALSLMAKTVAVTMPAVLVLLDVYALDRLPADWRVWNRPRFYRAWFEKIPFALLALAFAAAGIRAQKDFSAVLSYEHFGLTARLCQALFDVGFYLQKTLAPISLSPMYEFSRFTHPGLYLTAGAVAATALVAAWRLRRSAPWAWALWLYYLIVLFPLLGFVKTGEAAAANRYTYLACLSWALLAGAALREGATRRGRTAAVLAAALVLAALGAATRREIRYWNDSVSLWSHAVAVDSVSPFAQDNLAFALERAGRAEEAGEHRRLGRLSPASAYHDLGAAYYGRGDWPEAARYFYEAIEIHPALPNTQFDLGLCLFQLGRVDKAIDHIQFAINLRPADPDFHDGLGVVLARSGRFDAAIPEFQRALDLKPDFPEAQAALDAVRAQLRGSAR